VSLLTHLRSVVSRPARLALGVATLLCVARTVSGADEFYPTITVGPDTYTNVTVMNKTRNDIFVSHAHGMANLKVKDLDIPTQIKLGYQVEQAPPNKVHQALKTQDLTVLESNTHVQEAEEQIVAQAGEYLERLDDTTIYSATAFLILSYLLWCYLCRCICVKTSNPPSFLIWLPWVKQIPLFKAAGMSPAWILSNFIPPLFLIGYVIWCFRIVRARAKKAIYAVMLLLPVTNILAFFYLALSGSGAEEEKANPRVINLGNPPRRDAA
jgi:hypothetical protein